MFAKSESDPMSITRTEVLSLHREVSADAGGDGVCLVPPSLS